MAETRIAPEESEVRGFLEKLSNWGRWGPEEQRGTLNFIDEQVVMSALTLPRRGTTVSLSLPISYDAIPCDEDCCGALNGNPAYSVPQHFMLRSGEGLDPASIQREVTSDVFMIAPHGMLVTHLDAPSHTIFNGTMYNGVPGDLVRTEGGALAGAVDIVSSGIVGRGILLDVAAAQGRDSLEDGEGIYPEDLLACEEHQGVTVGRGDVLFVRTGYRKRKPHGPARKGSRPGLHAACLPWFHERQISVLATDVVADVAPHGYPSLGHPIHLVGMWAMGLWLVDNCALEELSTVCAGLGQWHFLAILSPLVLSRGTGSPINPLAIF